MTDGLPVIDYTRYYRRWHDGSQQHFNDMARGYESKLRQILTAIPRDGLIFELGCGGGFALGGVKRLGFENAFGCDADAGQVADAVRCGVAAEHVPVSDFPAYLDRVKAGGLDAVLMFDVLEHIPVSEQRAVLYRLRQAMKPGGILVCQVPNANALVASRFRYGDWTHACAFTEHSLDFVLFNSGFIDIEIKEADPPQFPPVDSRFPKRILAYVLRRLLHGIRRAEFGVEGGRMFAAAPMTPNIIAVAKRPHHDTQ